VKPRVGANSLTSTLENSQPERRTTGMPWAATSLPGHRRLAVGVS
jgi:hypothetical protein